MENTMKAIPSKIFENVHGTNWKSAVHYNEAKYNGDGLYGCSVNGENLDELFEEHIDAIENSDEVKVDVNNFGDYIFRVGEYEFHLFNDGFTGVFDITNQEWLEKDA